MDFDEIMNADRQRKQEAVRKAIQVLGYSERYPTTVIESGLRPGAVTEEKIDELLAKFATWFTSLGQRKS